MNISLPRRIPKKAAAATATITLLAAAAIGSPAAAHPGEDDGFWPTDYKAFGGPVEFALGDRDDVRFDVNRHGIALTLRKGEEDGTFTSRWYKPGGRFEYLVPSWQAETPPGTWVEVDLQVRTDNTDSHWYAIGQWAFDDGTIERQTLEDSQADDVGRIWVDTFASYDEPPGGMPHTYRLRATLHGDEDSDAAPTLRQVAATTTMPGDLPATASEPLLDEAKVLDVPKLSQSIHSGEYPQFGGGGQVWCSPTSTAMVMDYWDVGPDEDDLTTLPPDEVFDANGRADAQVPWAAIHTWDYVYEGAGNWPFNTAYASHYGLDGSVRHFSSLRGIERWIGKGVPVIVSIDWDNTDDNPLNDLDGSHISGTDGHLMVVVGFNEDGDVVVNDPASPDNEEVRRVYKRQQFERNWLRASNGTTYVIKDPSIWG